MCKIKVVLAEMEGDVGDELEGSLSLSCMMRRTMLRMRLSLCGLGFQKMVQEWMY